MTHNIAGFSVADRENTRDPDSWSARSTPPPRGVRGGWRNRTFACIENDASLLGNLRASVDAAAQDARWTTGNRWSRGT
jgi:hypothetical protein